MNINLKLSCDCNTLCAYIINKVINFYNIETDKEETMKLINEITSDKKLEEILKNMISSD